MNISKTLGELREASVNPDASKQSISRWSVGMHVHHCCLVIVEICNHLKNSVPPPPHSRSLFKFFLFLTGFIPRRRGVAPENTLPGESLSHQELHKVLDKSERAIEEIKNIDRQKWFNHPVFGVITRDEGIKFIEIHNRHHLKIIRDILA